MRRAVMLAGAAAFALASGLAVAQSVPESILPPGFDDPAPSPTPAPRATATPRPAASGAAPAPAAPAGSGGTSTPVVQPIPGGTSAPPAAAASLPTIDGKLPTLAELERMSTDELDELLGLKPKVDIPPAARRTMSEVGVLDPSEGGLPTASLANQPAALVRAVLGGTTRPIVSRWGHILMRRALASRLAAPRDMDPAEFAALRIAALNAMGEYAVARAVAQDIDTADWTPNLTAAAMDAYVGTADIVGACPAVRLHGNVREDGTWRLFQGICNAYSGEAARAKADLNRVRSRRQAAEIDALLAQRFAGAAGQGRGAVTIEWDGVTDLTPLRFALASAVGEPVPDTLLTEAGPWYHRAAAVAPMLPLTQRIAAAQTAGRSGILSSSAMIDLYSQLHAEPDIEGPEADTAGLLRKAYVGGSTMARMNAIRRVWFGASADDDAQGAASSIDYARLVLTAYAAARMEPAEELVDEAGTLIAAMLAAGLERDALRWTAIVADGSPAWAQLAFAAPDRGQPVDDDAIDDFVGDDDSADKRRSQFLVAGLAGLGRMDPDSVEGYSDDMGMNLGGQTRWTRAIDAAAAADNPALVAFLAGLGMQGDGWERMTARHLYHIVGGLRRVGLENEARMIAAEAVARG